MLTDLEIHNILAPQITKTIIEEMPDFSSRMVLLESIIVGIVSCLFKPGFHEKVLAKLKEDVLKRLQKFPDRGVTLQ